MPIQISFDRILLSAVSCLAWATIPLFFPSAEKLYPFLVPLLFSGSVLTSNPDRIRRLKWHPAILICLPLLIGVVGINLVLISFFFLQTGLREYALQIACLLSGLTTLLIFRIFLQMGHLWIGIGISSLTAIWIPGLTEYLKEAKLLHLPGFEDPLPLLFCWQLVTGFAISVAIWIRRIPGKPKEPMEYSTS